MSRLVERFDSNQAYEHMERAKREGRTQREGFSDYLATLGISRAEDTEAFLEKFDEEYQQSTERMKGYLEEMRHLVREIQRKYAPV